MALNNSPFQSSDTRITEAQLAETKGQIFRSGYFTLSSSDYSAITGGYQATKQIELWTYSASLDVGNRYLAALRPAFEVYHQTGNNTVDDYYSGSSFYVQKADYTIYENHSTGEINRNCTARLYQTYSIPYFTIYLEVVYFTKNSTGYTWAVDGVNYFFWLINNTNIVQSLSATAP